MEKISSFTVDHIRLVPGVYVSRKDKVGVETVTTFDLRFTKPNVEPAMENAAMHAIEHLALIEHAAAAVDDETILFQILGEGLAA